MKNLLPLLIVVLVWSCKSEKDVDPANSATFLRYFGSENNHTAVLALEANNGFALLSNVDIPVGNLGDFKYKIRFIRTDLNGNPIGHTEYPALNTPSPPPDDPKLDGYKASSFIALDDGYLIIGERINIAEAGSTVIPTQLFLQMIDFEGVVQWSDTLGSAAGNLHGRGVAKDADGNFIVLGSITDGSTSDDMFVAKINKDNREVIWRRQYGQGTATLANRLYFYGDQNVCWGGSVTDLRASADVRLIVAPEDALNANLQNFCCDPVTEEIAVDFCETLGGFAFVGSKRGADGDNDIFFTKISQRGAELATPELPVDFDHLNDIGSSICPGVDGGYMILATVESGSTKGNGKEDYYLLKVDDRGQPVEGAGITYGGPDKEEGASIRSTSDGSYLVFGTTTFGNLKKLMLMKVNAEGRL
jgi:hypothetical protein